MSPEGAEWTRAALETLRAERFGPGAWIRFLAASRARAREGRAAHPRAHRQLRALALAALGAAAGAAALLGPAAGLAAAPWWGLVLLMADWHLGLLDRGLERPVDGIGVPNLLTLLRAAAIPLLPFLAGGGFAAALGLVGATDVADGVLARRRGPQTELGRWLDASADAAALPVAAAALAARGLLPAAVAGLVAARHAVPWLAGAAVCFLEARPPERRELVSGRAPGLVLFAGLALAALALPGGAALAAAGAAGGLAAVAASAARRRAAC